jgi:hypothetical protein
VCVCDWMGGCVIVNLVRVCVCLCVRVRACSCVFVCFARV